MRLIFQLGLMLLTLLGVSSRVWGKVALGEKSAGLGFAESCMFVSLIDTPPVLMSSGEAAVWGYDLGMQDGPNLYAYVSENPWSKFDPDGLSEVYLVGGVRREADPVNGHDNSAHHFYTSAARVAKERAAALKKAGSSEKVTVIMYEPAYETRATNDKKVDSAGKPDSRFHQKLMEDAGKKYGFDVKFAKDEKAMITETAKATATDPMKNGGYFGHSNKDQFLVNYGESAPSSGTVDTATKLIGADDFKKGGVQFDPNAKFTSYGCHQGEPGGMMEQLNKDQKIETTGSEGKTLYGPIGKGKSIPDSEKGYKTHSKPKPNP